MAGKRIHVTIGMGRAHMLRFRAEELGVPVARLAAQMIDTAVDRLVADEAFIKRWEQASQRKAEERKLKAWEGKT
jgi:hypothetical protein